MLLLVAAMLAGCGKNAPTTLEEYMDQNPQAKQKIEDQVKQMQDDDLIIKVEYEKNIVKITETMTTTYSKAITKKLKESFDKGKLENDETLQKLIKQIEDISMIPGIGIQVVINNGDETRIWSKEYK